MTFPINLFFMVFFPCVLGVQHRYKLIVDNFTVAYSDEKYIDVSAGICKFNNTNAVNITFRNKVDFPDNVKCVVKAFILHKSDLGLPLVQFEKNLKDIIEMEMFDMQSVWIYHARPPVVWPIKTNVTYRIERWIPDSSQFPTNIPIGKWKIEISQRFANKTKIVIYNMFAKTDYHK